jgi:hypothetical protein
MERAKDWRRSAEARSSCRLPLLRKRLRLFRRRASCAAYDIRRNHRASLLDIVSAHDSKATSWFPELAESSKSMRERFAAARRNRRGHLTDENRRFLRIFKRATHAGSFGYSTRLAELAVDLPATQDSIHLLPPITKLECGSSMQVNRGFAGRSKQNDRTHRNDSSTARGPEREKGAVRCYQPRSRSTAQRVRGSCSSRLKICRTLKNLEGRVAPGRSSSLSQARVPTRRSVRIAHLSRSRQATRPYRGARRCRLLGAFPSLVEAKPDNSGLNPSWAI